MRKLHIYQSCAHIIRLVFTFVLLFILTSCGSQGLLVESMKETKETTEEVTTESIEVVSEEESNNEAIFSETKEPNDSSDDVTLSVYVCGAVVNEGVYELPEGSRISDALNMAGGYDENALHGYVNLAERLEDGERIYFPSYEELEELGIVPFSGEDSESNAEDGSPGDVNSLVNINTAGADELKKLPGIGDTKAADIITYREQHGSFTSIEDIKNVSGIGESTYNRISSLITVE